MCKKNSHIKISESDVPIYVPAGHAGTYNKRLAGRFNCSNNIEFIIDEIDETGDAEAHVHDDVDQMIYLLEGKLRIISPGKEDLMVPGELVIFAKGVEHRAISASKKARFAVIYGPPKE